MEFSFHRSAAQGSYRKILLIMRLTAILLLACFLHAGARGFSQTVTLSVSNMPLEKVCDQIEQQTGYYFVYAKTRNEQNHLISIHLKNANINDALRSLFAGLPFTYQVIDKVVVVNTIGQARPEETGPLPADTLMIKGRVINVQGEALVNASVVSVRTKIAAQTNEKGEFLLKGLLPEDELRVSYIGYKTLTVKVGHRNLVTAVMEITNNELDKMVVQAYGATSRRFTTSNIGVVSGEEIRKQPVMDPLLALSGRVAGLIIQPLDGNESGQIKVEIRGRNGINPLFSSDPLYIIDGVPLTVLDVAAPKVPFGSTTAVSFGFDQTKLSPAGGQNPLYSLNPADIESIEVLKDADATAIYGSRGANGVILITTRKGRPGKSRLDLNASQGLNFVTRTWDMLKTPQYLAMRREAFKNDGITPTAAPGAGFAPDLLIWDTTRYTDWQKFFWGGTGKWTDVQVGLSGGNAQTTYRLAGGYRRSTDITSVSGANQKLSLSFNLNNTSLNQRLRVSFSANYSFADVNLIDLSANATLPPDAPAVFDSKGNLNYAPWDAAGLYFPFAGLLCPYEGKTSFLTSNLNLNYTLVKGLAAKATLGYNNTLMNQTMFIPIASKDPVSTVKPVGYASFGNSQVHNWIIEPQLEYNGIVGGGALNILFGGTLQSNTTEGILTTGSGYTNDALLHSISNAPIVTSTDNYGMYKYTGVFGRVGYNWDRKYILNLNARRDGSSRFGAGKQFGNFASAGAAWIISEEQLVRRILPRSVSFIKLRGSYGITGSDAVGDYKYLSQWGNGAPALATYDGISPLSAQIEPNPNFHWQVNKKLEMALDLGFLEDRINLEAAYYRDRCDNQLVGLPISSFTGFTSVVANSPANVQNDGLEFLLNAKIVNGKKFSWSVDFNIGHNRNKLLAYPHFDQSTYYTTFKIGQSLDNRYLFHYTGINPLTGQYTYTDWNHDGIIKDNESVPPGTGTDDRYIAVNLAPEFDGGLNSHFTYKNWQVSLFFHFSKRNGSNALAIDAPSTSQIKNTSTWEYDHRWTYPGQLADAPKLTTQSSLAAGNFTTSDGSITDASFIRLKTVAIGWSLPAQWAKKAGIGGLSVNVNAQNIFVFTKYKGADPETNNFGSMPPARTITAGISCSF